MPDKKEILIRDLQYLVEGWEPPQDLTKIPDALKELPTYWGGKKNEFEFIFGTRVYLVKFDCLDVTIFLNNEKIVYFLLPSHRRTFVVNEITLKGHFKRIFSRDGVLTLTGFKWDD